ncbi:hypothetical protein [Demequina muriae]|uniref:DUF2975 domain-containing protein n=1 Tax=Demequina muriae TaxID=3051664 RepID=A0ABT8GGW0_9MICO|nr:hypothetical protein [Demequina sp. EGI L300058]MDN4480672.1 hypothetical protein [Demequina sp. EGI L300058]
MDERTQLDRSDRIGMYGSIVMVAIGIGLAVASAVVRLSEVWSGQDIPVTVPLSDETAALPLGPDGAAVDATIETATVVVADPAPATLFALWAQPIWFAVATSAGLVIAAMFFLRLARGRAFTSGASRLAFAGAIVLTVGWFGSGILTNMTTNGALSAISDYTYESVTFEVDLAPGLAILVIAAIGAALQIGERLQRETEGLV